MTTNQAFLQRCLGHPVFAAATATTAFIGEHLAELLVADAEVATRAAALAAVLLFETGADIAGATAGRRLPHKLPVTLRLELAGAVREVSLVLTPPRHFSVALAERTVEIDVLALGVESLRFRCDGVEESAAYHRDGPMLLLHYRGVPLRADDLSRAAAAPPGDACGDGKLRASTSGRVVALLVAIGDAVHAGQPIVTLEAMKMEHVHAAAGAGTVLALHVQAGDQVAAGRIVAEIELAIDAAAAPGAPCQNASDACASRTIGLAGPTLRALRIKP